MNRRRCGSSPRVRGRVRGTVIREGLAGFPQLYLLDPGLNTIDVNAAPM